MHHRPMKDTEMSLTQQSDEAAESKPQVKVAVTSVRHAAVVLVALLQCHNYDCNTAALSSIQN